MTDQARSDAERSTYAFTAPDLPEMPKRELLDGLSREELWRYACHVGYRVALKETHAAAATPPAALQDARDAERLRFLIKRLPADVFADREVSSPESWREAIDAAIAASAGKESP